MIRPENDEAKYENFGVIIWSAMAEIENNTLQICAPLARSENKNGVIF